MNNYKIFKIMIVVTIISILIYVSNNIFYKNSNYFIYEKNEEEQNLNFKIHIFNYDKKNFDIINVNNNSPFIDEGDYIKEVIKNMPFYNSNYNFLSVYTLEIENKKTLIVKLNKEFLKLDDKNMDILIKSINKTIISYFKIDEIMIEFDSN